jgi:hypothetical protein
MRASVTFILSLSVLAAACGEEGSGDAGSRDGAVADAGTADSGSADAAPADVGGRDAGRADAAPPDAALDGGDVIEPTPILERPGERTVTCSTSVGVTEQLPRSWYQGGHAVVERGGEALVVRTESSPPTPFEYAPTSLVFGALASDGSLAAPTEVLALDDDLSRSAPTAAVVDGRLLMVWVEGASLWSAVETDDGVSAPRNLRLAASPFGRPSLVAGHGGAALVYTTGDFSDFALWFVRLDATGAPIGQPRMIAAQEDELLHTLVASPSGWALLYTRKDLAFLPLAVDGTPGALASIPASAGHALSRGAMFDRGQLALLAHGDAFLAAWVEAGGFGEEDAYTAVRLARLDASGALLGTPSWVRAPEADITEAEPRLSWFAPGKAALTWAHGTMIYICAGCTPDHRVDLLVFDPDRLVPLGEVATLPPPPTRFRTAGLLRRAEAWVGDELRMALGLTFHLHSEPVTAVMRCVE